MIEAGHEKEDDLLTSSFIDFIVSLRLFRPDFVIVISKVDKHIYYKSIFGENFNGEQYIRRLPFTYAILVKYNLKYAVLDFTVDRGKRLIINEFYSFDRSSPEKLWDVFYRLSRQRKQMPVFFKFIAWLTDKYSI